MGGLRLIVVAVFAVAQTALADDANNFKSMIAGFEVTKPAKWRFLTAEQNLESLKGGQLNDKEFQAAIARYASAPLVAMTKHGEPFDDLNPSFKVNVRPLGRFKGAAPTELLEFLAPQLERLFKDFVIVQAPVEVEVSGFAAAYMRMNYSMQIADGRTFPTTSELWVVPRGDYFFMIGAGTRQDEATGTRQEIKAILDTVRIRP
jgi:hypothetical protein